MLFPNILHNFFLADKMILTLSWQGSLLYSNQLIIVAKLYILDICRGPCYAYKERSVNQEMIIISIYIVGNETKGRILKRR